MNTERRRICYGVAASLDGYIAGPNGEADWIPMDPDIDFAAIWARFDTLLIGRKTFATMAKPGRKYRSQRGMTTVVFSRTLNPRDYPGVTMVSDRVAETIAALKATPGKDIWLFGGGELFRSLAGMALVDVVSVALVPVLLGGGVPLFPPQGQRVPLELTSQRTYDKSGIVSLEYSVMNRRAG